MCMRCGADKEIVLCKEDFPSWRQVNLLSSEYVDGLVTPLIGKMCVEQG